MDIKVILQALGRDWLIEEQHAYQYAELFLKILHGDMKFEAGMFGSNDSAYRVNANNNRTMNGEVLVIPVAGPLMKNDFCGSMGMNTMAKMVSAANMDNTIQSIVLSIDSPGGTVDGTENFANVVRSSAKPVVSFADKIASAAYWIGSSADELVLSGETSMAGSIGTMARLTDTRAAQEKNGVREVVFTATRSIHKNSSMQQALDGKPDAYVQEFLDPLNSVFEKAVSQNRDGKIDLSKEDVMTGKVYLGKQAVKVGLADKIGSLDYAIKRSLQLAKTITK